MSWQQPCPDGVLRTIEMPCPDGVLRTIEMPCPDGCGGEWHYPAAERDRVIEQDNLPASKHGRITAANKIDGDFIKQALKRWGIEHPRP